MREGAKAQDLPEGAGEGMLKAGGMMEQLLQDDTLRIFALAEPLAALER